MNAGDKYPTMHHFVTGMCTFLLQNGALWRRPGGRLPNLRNPYLCNCLMDFHRSKLCGMSRPVVVHCHGHLPICPIWACPWTKNLSNLAQIGSRLCGTHISETTGWIYPIWSFMDLSGPVVVQCHSYLPICPIWACPWAKNLSNQAALGPHFAEPISLKPLDGFIPFEVLWNCLDLQLCNIMVIWPWPWISKVKFWKCCISGMGGPINMERKGCESIGC